MHIEALWDRPSLKMGAILRSFGKRRSAARRVTGAGVAVLIVAGVIRAFAPTNTHTGASDLAQSYMKSGDYARAAETLRASYRAKPTESLRMELARALLGAGDFDGALEVLEPETDDPTSSYLRSHLRAEAYVRLHRFEDASRAGAGLADARPGDSRALLMMARAAYGLGRFGDARQRLSEALRLGGEALDDAWLFRARLALDENDLAVAQSALKRAVEAGATGREERAVAIEAMVRSGDFAGARVAIDALKAAKARRRVVHVDPQKEYLTAYLEAAQGDYALAARRLRTIEPWIASEPHGALLMAMTRELSGDGAQAESQYLSELSRAPNNPLLLEALIARLLRLERLDEADLYIKTLTQVAPRAGLAARMDAARARSDDGQLLLAAKVLANEGIESPVAAAVFGPASSAALQAFEAHQANYALVAAARALSAGDDEARQAAADLSILARDPAAFTLAGELYLAVGEDERARMAFDKAARLDPAFKAAADGRLRVDIRSGDLAAASARLTAQIDAEPDAMAARVRLARVMQASGRSVSAALILRPADSKIAGDLDAAVVYASVLADSGDAARLHDFAGRVRRNFPTAPAAARVLDAAGRFEDAALVAREALLDAPHEPQRVASYVAAMRKISRATDARAFLEAMAVKRPNLSSISSALAALVAAPSGESGAAGYPAAPGRISDLRRSYLLDPSNTEAASQYGAALLRAGKRDLGLRVLREACFWAPRAGCAARELRDS